MINPLVTVATHPIGGRGKLSAWMRVLSWQLRSRLIPGEHTVAWVGGLRLVMRSGDTGLTGNYYCGLHDYSEMAFLLHLLDEESLFVDIGANLGSYTLLAAGLCKSRCLAIEPVPSTFSRLAQNIELNQLQDQVGLENIGLSDSTGTLRFSQLEDSSLNRVLASEDAGGVDVEVRTLDEQLQGAVPTLIKIDVEGHEPSVLEGANQTLSHGTIVLIETLDNVSAIDEYMTELGYSAWRYEPQTRELQPVEQLAQNTLYIRDVGAVRDRIASASATTIHGVTF